MRHGVRIGVDVGSVRIGIARSDPHGLLATPVETVRRGTGDVGRIAELAAEHEAMEVIVGLPAHLSGAEGAAAKAARAFATALERRTGLPVRLYDERLTTVTAEQVLRSGGSYGKGRGKARRKVVDQAAATVLLQGALDAERLTGRPPGVNVRDGS